MTNASTRAKIFVRVAFACVSVAALAQSNPLADELAKNRYSLSMQDGHLSGPGAQVIHDLVSDSQFVMVGEDHGVAQIPQFVGALCDKLAPQGFHTFAVEAGPLVAGELQPWIAKPDHLAKTAEFEKKFPDSIAFFNMVQENDLLAHCAAASPGTFQLWGLDQELMGASGYMLSRILETRPGPKATGVVQQAIQDEAKARAKAAETGNAGALYMLSASEDEFKALRGALTADGSAEARSLFDQLAITRQIYQESMNGQGAVSNRRRALLMKANFTRYYDAATRAEGKPPKVLFKFGDWHLYKGFNPLHNNDLGNFLVELADEHGQKTAHIIILGVEGPHLHFAGIGHPYQADSTKILDDPDYKFMKPMVDNLAPEGWTVFDLRGLRKNFRSLGPVDTATERLIFGYDVLVLIPQVTASQQIH
jgi:hypothetical protein